MNTTIDHLRQMLENIRTIGFWSRLFGWRRIKDQMIDAHADLERLLAELSSAKTALESERGISNGIANKNDLLTQKNDYLAGEVKRLQTDEERRQQEFGRQMATLKQYQDRIQADRDEEVKVRHDVEIERLKKMKDTWVLHQESVKQSMKLLCSRHTIEYIDKVSFKGDPDNTVSIVGEFIIFDAKSPKGDDLSNFPGYIREQAEKAKKYANEESVKKWIFFVVPMNTLGVLKTFVYHLSDYQVFVITVDALEPILLSLQKIEEYEFAEQFSPEDRENICRILGKFAHLSKRRIQVDTYFINQFMELAYKCESDLPSNVLEKVIEFERAEKLNPPQEKRTKVIPMAELEKSLIKVQNDANNKGIALEDGRLTDGLNEVPLYRDELTHPR